ncbi:MAG: helix-turn-helix domain-containing protein [Rhodospirillales bacterium]|nr:helix-turn-helix domain-containing protein [Rhodospirillales bacterium]
MNDESMLLNTDQAAQRLGLSPRTLERYRVTGEGPEYLKIGRAVRYTVSALERWLKGCKR